MARTREQLAARFATFASKARWMRARSCACYGSTTRNTWQFVRRLRRWTTLTTNRFPSAGLNPLGELLERHGIQVSKVTKGARIITAGW